MIKILFVLTAISPIILHAQWVEDYYKPVEQSRVYLGGDYAAFRMSLRNFTDVYESRWGQSFGGFVGVRAFSSYYVAARYGTFNQSGRSGVHEASGESLGTARWQEQWLKLGLRIHPPTEKKWGSYYGFGIGFFFIKEAEPISVFNFLSEQSSSFAGNGSGFYLELGVDYFVLDKLAAFVDVEISSAGMRGRSTFEAMSVGGWRFSTGLVFWPF